MHPAVRFEVVWPLECFLANVTLVGTKLTGNLEVLVQGHLQTIGLFTNGASVLALLVLDGSVCFAVCLFTRLI